VLSKARSAGGSGIGIQGGTGKVAREDLQRPMDGVGHQERQVNFGLVLAPGAVATQFKPVLHPLENGRGRI